MNNSLVIARKILNNLIDLAASTYYSKTMAIMIEQFGLKQIMNTIRPIVPMINNSSEFNIFHQRKSQEAVNLISG